MFVYVRELYVGLCRVGDHEDVDELGADELREGVSEDVLDLDGRGTVGGQRVVGASAGDVGERGEVNVRERRGGCTNDLGCPAVQEPLELGRCVLCTVG